MGGFFSDVLGWVKRTAGDVADTAADIERGAQVGERVVDLSKRLPDISDEREPGTVELDLGGVRITAERQREPAQVAGIPVGIVVAGVLLFLLFR